MKVWTNEEVAWAGKTCLCFEQVDSTNEEAKRQAEKGTGHGTLIWAKSQSSGKGRRGREWYSPAGSSIYMTLLLKPDIPAEKASMFTLVAALAVSKGILRACGLETFIKWPNDIVAGGKKLCGILTELVLSEGHISCLVIGMGINVFQESFPEKLQQKATSVYLAGGRAVTGQALITEIMKEWESCYDRFLQAESLENLVEEYNRLLINRGRSVMIMEPGGGYEAKALGIDSLGRLLVEVPGGTVKEISAGEVSVRGVYGYV